MVAIKQFLESEIIYTSAPISGSRSTECATLLSLEFALTVPQGLSKLTIMELHLKPETEARLHELAATTAARRMNSSRTQ